MITILIVFIVLNILGIPSDWIRNASTDTSLILSCLFVISDIHIFLWCIRGRKVRKHE